MVIVFKKMYSKIIIFSEFWIVYRVCFTLSLMSKVKTKYNVDYLTVFLKKILLKNEHLQSVKG